VKDNKFAFIFVILAILTVPKQVYAIGLYGTKSSMDTFIDCLLRDPSADYCESLMILADPPANGITDISMSIKYNPTLWTFRENKSGFLCDFSSNGDCPPATASVGSFQPKQLSFNKGDPLPGSTVSIINDPVNGLVSLSYHLQDPITSVIDQNFFMFYFDYVKKFSPTDITVEYFDTPGTYDFTQTNFSCTTSLGDSCGSPTPITGFNVKIKPLLTTIDNFSATRNKNNKVKIELVTSSEKKTAVLQVYRAPSILQNLQQIQEVCKWDSAGTEVSGSTYSCEDKNAPANVVYWPADLEHNGTKNQYLEFITNVR